ncbi:MAG TPA: AMP-binding protein [Terriglobia bacterium]|nr:AMP-binding protein [Terriglobia bacterium]
MNHTPQKNRKATFTGRFSTLVEALLAAPPERPFVTVWKDEDDIQSVTFGEFVDLAKSHAAAFQAQGLAPGDTVILIMPQSIPLMAAFAGAMLLGAIPSILAYPNSKADPAKYNAGLAGVSHNLKARLVVVDEDFPATLLSHLVLADGAQLVYSSSLLFPSTAFRPPDYEHSSDRLAFIQHSAGTTGLQKGVALTHGAVLTQLEHLAAAIEIDSQDRIYSWLPLYHDMGLIACYMLPLVSHVPIVMQSPMDWVLQPVTMLELISSYRCTLAWVPNFALQFLARRVREEDRRDLDLSPLRALINCSEPIRGHSIDEFLAAYAAYGLQPTALQSSYAMAENVFAVTQSDIRTPPRRIWVDGSQLLEKNRAVPVAGNEGSCFVSSGRCLPDNKVRIVSSADGRELLEYEVGEIVIQSDSLFGGYHNRPDLSAAVVKDGWYWTGDLGFFADGELYVIGRKKDLIIVAGKNIYPQDIEEIVSRHPAIHDGRVVATGLYSDDQGTEEIIVVAELETPEDENESFQIERAIRNAIVEELGVVPRAIFLKPPAWIVKSTAGKPARSTTREKLLAEHPALIRG